MTINYFHVSIVGRANSGPPSRWNAQASAAYQSREPVLDRQQGKLWDLASGRGDLVAEAVMLPAGAPERWGNREELWNTVDMGESRRDSQLARSVVFALPRELRPEALVALARKFVQEAFVDKGMVADLAIHSKVARDGGDQTHAHVQLTMRRIVDGAFSYKETAWNRTRELVDWRRAWVAMANAWLAAAERVERMVVRAAEVLAEQRRSLGKLGQWIERGARMAERFIERRESGDADQRKWALELLSADKDYRTKPLEERLKEAQAVARWKETGLLPDEPSIAGRAVKALRGMAEKAREFIEREPDPMRGLMKSVNEAVAVSSIGVAFGNWDVKEAEAEIIRRYLVPAATRYPEVEARFNHLVLEVGNMLADKVDERLYSLVRDAEVMQRHVREELNPNRLREREAWIREMRGREREQERDPQRQDVEEGWAARPQLVADDGLSDNPWAGTKDFDKAREELRKDQAWEYEGAHNGSGRSEELPSQMDARHTREWKLFETAERYASLTPEEQKDVAQQEAAWKVRQQDPEVRHMQASVEDRIDSLSTGEKHKLDTRGATDVWVSRDAARRDMQQETQRTRDRER